jgi:peptide/nickel transport system substrate-binding protein
MTRIVTRLLHAVGRVSPVAALVVLLVTTPAGAQVPASDRPKAGGTVRLIWWNAPTTLNPYFSTAMSPSAFSELVLDGLARVAPDGSYVPELAEEIPTEANGDVSGDGTVVTWKLKPGLTWSDGQPFTSQDVVFTYQMLMDPANPVITRTDYAVINSVAAPDANTVVVTYKQLYAPYRLAFPYIFPAHVFSGRTDIAQNSFNQGPTVGTGPFVFTSGSGGDTLTFDRNPSYREPGKPNLDEVVVKFTPDRNNQVPALAAGDIDAALSLASTDLDRLSTLPDVSVDSAPSSSVSQLFMNTSCSSGPQQGDPACPHPILGDLRVRQAIDLAIDKQGLVHGLFADQVAAATSMLTVGPFAVNLPPTEFNPTKAQQVLDQAGWAVGSDGVRSKDGVRAHLSLIINAGGSVSESVSQVIQGNLQDVGIETVIKEVPNSVLSGGFPSNSPFSLGSFDLYSGSYTTPIDPQAFLRNHFASDQVPNSQLQSGINYDRVQDPKLDQALTAAGSTLDDTQRQAAYVSFSEQLQADEVVIPLFAALQIAARKSYVEGWGPTNVNDYVTWNIQDWWLNQ